MRLLLIPSLILGLSMAQPTYAEGEREATLYKNPQCGCCEGYAYFLRKAGFTVTVVSTHDLPLIKREHGVPDALEGCHTTIIDGYVIEGHVPIDLVQRLLQEHPDIVAISLPGMPMGSSPGMTGDKTEPFTVYEISKQPGGDPKVYAIE